MFPQRRLVASAAPRIVAQLRASATKTTSNVAAGPRRLMSSAPGPATNAAKDTNAVKDANAAKIAADIRSTFIKERQAVKHHAEETATLWRRISVYFVPVAILLAGYNAWNLWNEHWEHWEHMPPLEERVEYSYQNIRTKNYQWGDGDKTLFWNDKVNYHRKDKAT